MEMWTTQRTAEVERGKKLNSSWGFSFFFEGSELNKGRNTCHLQANVPFMKWLKYLIPLILQHTSKPTHKQASKQASTFFCYFDAFATPLKLQDLSNFKITSRMYPFCRALTKISDVLSCLPKNERPSNHIAIESVWLHNQWISIEVSGVWSVCTKKKVGEYGGWMWNYGSGKGGGAILYW